MSNRKLLGFKWLKFLYVWFIVRIVFDLFGILSSLGLIADIELRYGYAVDTSILYAAVYSLVVSTILKLLTVINRRKKFGFIAIHLTLVWGMVHCVIANLAYGLFNVIFGVAVTYSIIIPTFFYLNKRKNFLADGIPTVPIYYSPDSTAAPQDSAPIQPTKPVQTANSPPEPRTQPTRAAFDQVKKPQATPDNPPASAVVSKKQSPQITFTPLAPQQAPPKGGEPVHLPPVIANYTLPSEQCTVSPGLVPDFCTKCGAKQVADAAFCHKCGNKLD